MACPTASEKFFKPMDGQIKNRVGSTVYQDSGGGLYRRIGDTDYYKRIPDFRQAQSRYLDRQRIRYNSAELEIQGDVLNLRLPAAPGGRVGGGIRQSITEFSRRARKNMLERMARIDYSGRCTFITLTYHSDVPHKAAKGHLRAFIKRLVREHEDDNFAIVWRMDYQRRGTIHFHLMAFGLPFTEQSNMLDWWREITDQPTITNLNVQLIHDPKQARRYVSKYVAKVTLPEERAAYLATGTKQAETDLPGRFWGIEGRAYLPFAELISAILRFEQRAINQFKRYARRKWSGINNHQRRGFTLFIDNPDRWLLLLGHCLLELD